MRCSKFYLTTEASSALYQVACACNYGLWGIGYVNATWSGVKGGPLGVKGRRVTRGGEVGRLGAKGGPLGVGRRVGPLRGRARPESHKPRRPPKSPEHHIPTGPPWANLQPSDPPSHPQVAHPSAQVALLYHRWPTLHPKRPSHHPKWHAPPTHRLASERIGRPRKTASHSEF